MSAYIEAPNPNLKLNSPYHLNPKHPLNPDPTSPCKPPDLGLGFGALGLGFRLPCGGVLKIRVPSGYLYILSAAI